MSVEIACPRCRRVCFSTEEVIKHRCFDFEAALDAELALAAEHQRGTSTVGVDATCMFCGRHRVCLRVVEIGYLCLECHRPAGAA